jgi:hypothetical protein
MLEALERFESIEVSFVVPMSFSGMDNYWITCG